MKNPVFSDRSSQELDLAMLRAVALTNETYERLRGEPAFEGTMAAGGVLVGGGIGALVANEMTDEEITAFVLDIASKVRSAMSTLPHLASTHRV